MNECRDSPECFKCLRIDTICVQNVTLCGPNKYVIIGTKLRMYTIIGEVLSPYIIFFNFNLFIHNYTQQQQNVHAMQPV